MFKRDRWLTGLLRICASVSAGVLALIGLFTLWEAWPAVSQLSWTRLVSDDGWSPASAQPQYNLLPMLTGTLVVTLGSMVLTAPLGVGVATFLHFYAPRWLAGILRQVTQLLAGVPSVVFGLWGMAVLIPLLAEASPLGQGQSVLAGVLILSVMTLPTVVVAADAAVAAVPSDVVNGGYALGFGRRAVAWSIVLPAARRGIVGGIVLQTGRAIGETMAVLMVCGNIVQHPQGWHSPIRTLTANIALEMGYADSFHRSVLFLSGVLLLVMVLGIMLAAERWGSQEVSS